MFIKSGKYFKPIHFIAYNPPYVSYLSPDIVVATGSNVVLSVSTNGSFPITYQWYISVLPLIGKTTQVITLSNLQLTDSGNYNVFLQIIDILYNLVIF